MLSDSLLVVLGRMQAATQPCMACVCVNLYSDDNDPGHVGLCVMYSDQVTVCSAGDVMEYAWTTNALDFDDVQVKRMIVPFSTIPGMLHLMQYGYCDVMHTGMTLPLMAMDKGFNISIQGVRRKVLAIQHFVVFVRSPQGNFGLLRILTQQVYAHEH